MSAAGAAALAAPPLPWRRGLAWLLLLGPFFFLSYGFANWWAATQAQPGVVVFDWERRIPFVPWTILPYWSIDLFYGLSFLLCRDRREVDRHALRLLAAQLVAVACFIAFPLRFSFERPQADGVFGLLFDALAGFDKPFNQAPSLHIALLLILWVRYAAASRGALRGLVDLWALLIGVSVLSTYQHHFLDLPTGALLGLACLWAIPERGPLPLGAFRLATLPRRRALAWRYLGGAAACVALAAAGGAWLWLLWPACALALVALFYLGVGAAGFQKQADGRHSLAVRWLLAPYIAAAWLNSRLWTARRPQPEHIVDGVWLGRMPTRREMRRHGFAALCEFAAELPAPRGRWHLRSLPWLDLVAPSPAQLREAAAAIESLRHHGPLLVCCALGFSRSACALAAWLLCSGRAASVDAALASLAAARPQIVLSAAQLAALAQLAREGGHAPPGCHP